MTKKRRGRPPAKRRLVEPDGVVNEVVQLPTEPPPTVEAELDPTLPPPYSPEELKRLLSGVEVFPEQEHDVIVSRLLESIIAGVELDDPHFISLYAEGLQCLSISASTGTARVFDALSKCAHSETTTSIVGSLIILLTKSLQRGIIGPFDASELHRLCELISAVDHIGYMGTLMDENKLAPLRQKWVSFPDDEEASKMLGATVGTFDNLDNFLDRVDELETASPNVHQQGRVMVYTIFAHHKHLLECRAKQVARAVQLLDYCPTGALSAIEPMLQSCVDAKLRSASARGHYALALVLLSRLQLDETDLETLRKIFPMMARLSQMVPHTLKDVLDTLESMAARNDRCGGEDKQAVSQAILDTALTLVRDVRTYENQLELVAFFRTLRGQGHEIPREACEVLINNANGLSLLDRVCGILCQQKDTGKSPEHEELKKQVTKRVKDLCPASAQHSWRKQLQNVIRLEHPNLFQYLMPRTESNDSTASSPQRRRRERL